MYTHPSIYERNSFDENSKVKIRKTKMEFPLISMYKILTGFRLQKKSSNIFFTYFRILYNHKNNNSITFYDSYYPFNPANHYWSVKWNIYIVQHLM
jgi:hypothetical protein